MGELLHLFFNQSGQIKENITCRIPGPRDEENSNWKYSEHKLYRMKDKRFETESDDEFVEYDLFLIQTQSKKMKLSIKFVLNDTGYYRKKKAILLSEDTKIEDVDRLNYIGLPLNVWLNGKDTMRSIIDKYMVHSKRFYHFDGCYRVKDNDDIVQISKRRWRHYVPFWEFMWKSPNDYLLIHVRSKSYHETTQTKYLETYSD